jgi:hypothetical protein
MFIREKRPQKFLPYFELQEALQEEGCPVCHLLSRRSLAILDSLLYEQVTDPAIRKRLRDAQGLCNWHAWMLPRIPTGQSGIAIIYEDLLGHQIESLQTMRPALQPRTFWQRLKRHITRTARSPLTARRRMPCPVCCLVGNTNESSYITTLLDFLTETEFAQRFDASFGLCLPHLTQAIDQHLDHPNLRLLLDSEMQKFEALRGELREFIRKFDYRFTAEPVGKEGTAWRRAIELFVGKPEVFGNDRPGRKDHSETR